MPDERKIFEEILGPPPEGMISRGLLILILSLLSLLLCGLLIRVPQVIRGRIEIHRGNGWCEVRPERDARIADIFVSNGDSVSVGDTLVIFEDQLTYHDFLMLENFYSKISACLHKQDSLALQNIAFHWNNRKTTFDEEIQLLQTGLDEFTRLMGAECFYTERDDINAMLEKAGEMLVRQLNQVVLLEEECHLKEKNMKRMDSLFRTKVIPETELERQKLELLHSRQVLESACAMQLKQEHQIQVLKNELHELERTHKEELQNILDGIRKGTASLGEKLALWEQKNLVIAPLEGAVSFTTYWSRGQCLDAGESLLSILPDRPGGMLGKLVLPAKGNGQIREGQAVRISLDNLPVSEYGYFWGRIRSTSGKPEDGNYQAEVDLEISDRNRKYPEVKKIRFAEGTAEVILEEQSLIGMWLGDFR